MSSMLYGGGVTHSCPPSRTSPRAPAPETNNICPSPEQSKYCTSTRTRCPSVKEPQQHHNCRSSRRGHPWSSPPVSTQAEQTPTLCSLTNNPWPCSSQSTAAARSRLHQRRRQPAPGAEGPHPPPCSPRAPCPAPAAPQSSAPTSVARPTPCPCCWCAWVAATQPFPTKQPRPLSHPPAGAFPVLGSVKGEAAGQN